MLITQKIQVADIDSETSSVWRLTAKNVDDMQVLSVKDSDGNEYEDCHFGIYYNNGYVRFTINKTTDSTIIPDGTLFRLTVEPRVAKYEFTLHTGTETQMPDSFIEAIEGVGNVPAYRGQAYIVFQNLYIDEWRSVPNLSFEVNSGSSDLKDIIEDVSANEAGLDLDYVDATDLDGSTITGQSVEREASGRDQIEPLMTAYLFDGIEKDGKVVFSRRHADNALVIPYEDLGAHEGDEQTEPLTIIRADESELPRSVAVKYISGDWDYQEQSMQSKRQLVKAKTDVSVDTGLVMTDSEAQELADAKLYEQWINRDTYETALPIKYTDVVPGMVVKFTDEFGNLYPAVIAQSSFGKPGLNKISAIAIDGVIYNKATRSIDPSIGASDDQPSTSVYFEFLDLPKLPGDTTATDNIYFAACGPNYSGINIYTTKDNGATYDLLQQHTIAATMGYTVTELAPGTGNCWDRANTVDVVLVNGTLESRPEADVLNEFNAAVIGNEIIQFTTATLISTNTYRLSGLLRGKLGTEDQITEHTANDRFVLLTTATLGRIPSTIAKTYRIGPTLQTVDDITYIDYAFTNSARLNQPWAVCHVTKKEGSRICLFREEELPLLAPLPATPYELAQWKQATVQFNYHISVDGMLYSVPYEHIKRKVDVRITDKILEVFYNHNRIASHRRQYGRKGQYSTIVEHMPQDHQQYLEWNGDRFRRWAERIGRNIYIVVNAILISKRVEQQTYRSCMGLLKLADTYSEQRLEAACEKALSYTATPSYKSIKTILSTGQDKPLNEPATTRNSHGMTRGASYYGR